MVLGGPLEGFPFQETGIPNLRLLPSGPLPPNPSELLGSRRMLEIVERLQAEADYVLFDSPPVIAVTDAAVLASKVDGVLLVISAGKTKRDLAQKAKAMLEKVNARIVGVVLNNAKYDTSIHDYYAHSGDNN
jgi:non-specific protein-tyrosine kinase